MYQFFLKRNSIFSCLITLVLINSPAVTAATPVPIQQEKSTLTHDLANIKTTLAHLDEERRQTADKLSEAETDLASKAQELEQAITTAKNDSREKNQRAATLASIIYNRELTRTERLQGDIEAIDSKRSQLTSKATEISQRLASIEETIQATMETSIETGIDKASIAVAANKSLDITTPGKSPTNLATSALASKAATSKSAQQEQNPQKPTPAIRAPQWPTDTNATAADIAFARAALYPSTPADPDTSIFKKVKISSDLFGTKTMTFAGKNLYFVVAPSTFGNHKITVFAHDFWHQFAPQTDGQHYVFVYDANSLSAPELHIFPEALLRSTTH